MKDLIKGSLAGGMTSITGLTGNPLLTIATAITAPAASSVMVDFAERTLSEWQSSRLGRGYQMIAKIFKDKISQNQSFRLDGEMSILGGNQACQVLEGILQNIADEFEKKKLEAHAILFSNICFDERIIFEQALYITRILKQLSYRQLLLIALAHNHPLEAGNWQFKFKDSINPILSQYADLYGEIQNLEQMRIIENSSMGFSLGGASAPLRLGRLGNIIYQELDLGTLPEEEKQLLLQMISKVNYA